MEEPSPESTPIHGSQAALLMSPAGPNKTIASIAEEGSKEVTTEYSPYICPVCSARGQTRKKRRNVVLKEIANHFQNVVEFTKLISGNWKSTDV